MLGHLDFAKSLLNREPDLAAELNSQGSSPLHLASIKGYLELVKLLISANSDVCLVRDEDGRTPLHLAVMKGRDDVVKELVKARPEGIRYRIDRGETLLHVAVKHNRLGSLKMLMELAEEEIKGCDDLVNVKDDSGNTILHASTSLKQIEIVKYLISKPGVKVNAVNINGFTALDIIQNLPRDIKSIEIQECIVNAGALRTAKIIGTEHNNHPVPELSEMSTNASAQEKVAQVASKKSKKKKKGKKQYEWVEKKRDALMVVASVIAAMAYQAVLSPPGGIWDKDSDTNDTTPYKAGTTVMAVNDAGLHLRFWIGNTISLISSLSTIFLLVSGLPTKRRIFMCILMAAMWVTITSTAFSYMVSMMAITSTADNTVSLTTIEFALIAWLGLLGFVLLAQTVRLMIKIVRKVYKCCFPRLRKEGEETNQAPV